MWEQQEGALYLTHGMVEVRRYGWDQRESLTFSRDDYMLSRVVSRKTQSQRIDWRLPCAGKGVPAQQMSIVAPGCPVDVAFDDGEALVISCILEPGYFRNVTGIADWNEQHTLACLGLSNPIIGLIFDRLAHEVRIGRQQSCDVARQFTDALAQEVGRGLLRSLGEERNGELVAWQLQRIYAQLDDEDCEQRITIKQIAHHCELSTRHLMRAFKATTGMTLHQFINEARTQRAMKLLRNGDIAVMDVARKLGFQSSSAFSAAFIQTVGMTPTEYRCRVRAH